MIGLAYDPLISVVVFDALAAASQISGTFPGASRLGGSKVP
jgi:hypothetical protein